MAIFPGAEGDDILARRGIAAVVEEMAARKRERMTLLSHEEGVALLRDLQGEIEGEIDFESEFNARYATVLQEFEQPLSDEATGALYFRGIALAEEYFRKRSSVLAIHAICNGLQEKLIRKSLQRAEELIEGERPSPFCCLAAGSIGRREATLCVDPILFIIHAEVPADEGDYFQQLGHRFLVLLEQVGIVKGGSARAARKQLWVGSRSSWRQEIVEELIEGEHPRLLELVRRADVRLLAGDPSIAEEMVNTVWSMLEFRHEEFRESSRGAMIASRTRAAFSFPLPALLGVAKGAAEMPTGLDFFSRLRLERSGKHQGMFNLERYAADPLITNVRMLAVNYGLRETSTVGRIKTLLERGHLSVDLTERLLFAYHDFARLKLGRQIAGGCEKEADCFIDPRELSADDEFQLRSGLEAVTGLEKIAYLCFAEQG